MKPVVVSGVPGTEDVTAALERDRRTVAGDAVGRRGGRLAVYSASWQPECSLNGDSRLPRASNSSLKLSAPISISLRPSRAGRHPCETRSRVTSEVFAI